MLDYSLKSAENYNVIVENKTGVEIKVSKDPKKAREMLRNLNMGGGFEGFTPTFFSWKGLGTR